MSFPALTALEEVGLDIRVKLGDFFLPTLLELCDLLRQRVMDDYDMHHMAFCMTFV